jgi:D-alanyl-lipoteichoic acid acyltransferase DltB (MBOAT superfamily)
MLFHTWIFLPFFLITYAIYLALNRTKLRNVWILIASYVFYGCWNPLYLILIAYSTVVDYIVLAMMEKSRFRKTWATISILNNLFLLGFFKYGGFISENANLLLTRFGSSYAIETPSWLLPVALSFYVFKSVGYVVDCYRGDVGRETNFIRHAVFVSFFPILIAGPIERAANLLPQLRKPAHIGFGDVADGLSLFIVGLFKKVALADGLALYVDRVYDAPGRWQSPALILATLAFTWQIYFDFSGYTDMARGIGRMMGFEIMRNFNHPYLATGLGDFWRRWHISLSTWFRDYVYIPLGGNRKGKFNTYRNLFLAMVISGLWHGAAWTFIIWGALHAIGLMLTRQLERNAFYRDSLPTVIKQAWVFVFVSFAWIFFRADSWPTACLIVSKIFTSGWSDPRFPMLLAILICAVWSYQAVCESRLKRILKTTPVRISLAVLMILYLVLFAPSTGQPFIYNQF